MSKLVLAGATVGYYWYMSSPSGRAAVKAREGQRTLMWHVKRKGYK